MYQNNPMGIELFFQEQTFFCFKIANWSRVKKNSGKQSEKSVAWGRKLGGGAYSLCFDVAHPWYQILVSWSVWWVRSLTVDKWAMKNAHILVNVIEDDAFQHKKNIIAPNHVSRSNLDIRVLGISVDFK